jgi:hypothetical protein
MQQDRGAIQNMIASHQPLSVVARLTKFGLTPEKEATLLKLVCRDHTKTYGLAR